MEAGCWSSRSQRTQCKLGEAFRNSRPVGSTFQLSDLLRFDDVPGFVLKTRLQFVGQQPACEKPVQRLATPLGATNPDPSSVDAAIRLPIAGRNSLRCLLPNIEEQSAVRARLSPFFLRPEKQARKFIYRLSEKNSNRRRVPAEHPAGTCSL